MTRSSKPADKSGVRARTLSRMQVLLHTATAGALAYSCRDSGYMVVDPMPMPARCAGRPPDLTASAQVVAAGDGSAEVMVILGVIKTESAKYVDEAPQVENGAVVFWRVTETGLEVRVRGTGRVTVTLPLSCSDGPGKLQVVLEVAPDPQPGQQVPAQVNPLY